MAEQANDEQTRETRQERRERRHQAERSRIGKSGRSLVTLDTNAAFARPGTAAHTRSSRGPRRKRRA